LLRPMGASNSLLCRLILMQLLMIARRMDGQWTEGWAVLRGSLESPLIELYNGKVAEMDFMRGNGVYSQGSMAFWLQGGFEMLLCYFPVSFGPGLL
jgi:hypothetical protein